ncbi:hypothetical protein [Sphingopyxis sp. KK2]|uniref:hypothetical protein n=1 Tax=Sphingopyxis sp. KK2 TaxID=1855727 RepID=UPI00097E6E95|nr:hypothetical protein [Sphingopyxis sp. KK2]
MKYPILAAAMLAAATAPSATAMTIDADERELYDDSIQCMAFFGIMAGLGSEGVAEDPKMVESGTKFLAIATVLADEDDAQIKTDFERQMRAFAAIAENAEDPGMVQKVKDIDENCKFLETLVDAMLESSS